MAAAAVQTLGPIGQPDISYKPDLDKYLARVQRRLTSESLSRRLPAGLPAQLKSTLVWSGHDVAEKYDWTYVLSAEDLVEVEVALLHFKTLNKPLGYISPETFPLPRLNLVLREISKELHLGHGFKVVRGLPVTKHTREENIIIYAGISSHIAPERGRQDHQFNGKPADVVMNHIIDLSRTPDAGRIGSPAYTNDKQVFHTDSGAHIVSLLALDLSASGGQSLLASTWHVYNELAKTRPDLIQTLTESWVIDGFGNPQVPFLERPLLFHQQANGEQTERIFLQYNRRSFTGFDALPRSSQIAPITEAQAEALDTLHFLAEKHCTALDFRQGDVQYINNLSMMHARGSFVDTDEKRRHLLRFWLRDPEYAWVVPNGLQSQFDSVYADIDPEKQVFSLQPQIRSSSDGKLENREGSSKGLVL